MDDAELVQAALAGDRAAFGAIFDRYGPRIHGFCTRLLNEPHTASDATQDAFVAAAQRLDQLRDPANLRAWLYAIARNECTRHGRARARAVPTEDSVMAAATGDDLTADEPAQAAAASEVGAILWDAAEGLDESDRMLLELTVRHGLEGAELAQAANVSPGQISMVTGRMRERVARSVGALLIARKGQADCAGLQSVLVGWDGTFSVLIRKRVARHIDQCEVCDERRAALVAPLGSLALGPALVAFTVPDGFDAMRERALEAFDARGSAPAGPSGRRRSSVALLVAAVVLVLLGLAIFLRPDDDRTLVAAGSDAVATTTSESELGSATTTSAPTTTTIPTSVPATSPQQAGSTTVPPDVGAPTTSSPSPPATLSPPTVVPAPAPAPNPPPNQAPTVGSTSRSGSSSMQTSCNPANATRTITVSATDDEALSTVVLRWNQTGGGTGERAMTRSGSVWTATLGPFTNTGNVSYRAVATDGDGASSSSPTASVTVDPCPG